MSYIPYRTATQWQEYYAENPLSSLSDEQKVRIDILGATENNGSSSISGDVVFSCITATNSYTSATVPSLANQSTRDANLVRLAGSTIDPSLYTWDGTTFTFDASITIVGGETVYISFS